MVDIVLDDSAPDAEYALGACWSCDGVVELFALLGELLVDFPNMAFSYCGLGVLGI
jgi:hypothetical protein